MTFGDIFQLHIFFYGKKYKKRGDNVMEKTLGKVMKSKAICLGEHKSYIFSKKDVEVTAHSDNGCYLELKPIDESRCWSNDQFRLHFGKDYLLKNHSITFRMSDLNKKKEMFVLPVAFMNLTNIRVGDVLKIWRNGESVIIEGKEGICAASGKTISRYKNRKKMFNVSKPTQRLLPLMREEISKHDSLSFKDSLSVSVENILNETKKRADLILHIEKTIAEMRGKLAE